MSYHFLLSEIALKKRFYYRSLTPIESTAMSEAQVNQQTFRDMFAFGSAIKEQFDLGEFELAKVMRAGWNALDVLPAGQLALTEDAVVNGQRKAIVTMSDIKSGKVAAKFSFTIDLSGCVTVVYEQVMAKCVPEDASPQQSLDLIPAT